MNRISNNGREYLIDETELAERKAFLEFTEADATLLEQLHAPLQEYADEFTRAFYDFVLGFPELHALVPDDETLERLKKSQSAYFRSLTGGDYSEDYVRHRLRVGAAHQRVGMAPKWYIGSYGKYLSFHLPLLCRLSDGDEQKFLATYGALLKVILFDMGLAIDTYIDADKQAITQLQQRLRNLLDGIDAIVWETDADMRFTFVSFRAQEMLGYPLEHWTERPNFWRKIVLPEDCEPTISRFLQEIAAGRDHEMEYRARAADGRTVWIHERVSVVTGPDGNIEMLRGLMVDITKFKEAELKLAHLAAYDELTGLLNRTLLQDRMRQALAQSDRSGDMVAILFIDLDRFKIVNDSLGHDIGDTVLQTAAGLLTGCIREVDTVARLGGDEFVVMLTGIGKMEDITGVARKTLETLASPFTVNAHEFFLTASIGISVYPKDGDDAQTLLKNADTAMYRAKDGGKNRFEFFTREMNAVAMRRLHLENQLRQALERNEFVLHYQPQMDIESGRIVGVEALVHWQHPEMGMVPPAEFIPLAEETGLIIPLSEWVLETACRRAVAWQNAGLPKLRMAVNLSARHFQEADLPETVARILRETAFDPELLELEITESMLMQDIGKAATILHALRHQLGVCLSVDDFGTGYSSLAYLKRFPVMKVKIDRSFVCNVTTDGDDAALAEAIIAMAHSLRLSVTAEGVETKGQLEFLANLRCNEAQGYYLSRPMPPDECAAWLSQSGGL